MPKNETDFSPSAVFDAMASEFAQQLRAGKSPDIDEFASRDQKLAARIQRLFPVLEMMERNGRNEDWSEADLVKAEQNFQKLNGEKWKAPKRLGDFRLIRQIGRGGMGVVYEAEQESLGRHVAIKILPESAQFDERRTERFATEAKASAMLHHTNIVPVFGIGRENGLSFIVMQYIQGQPLSIVLRDIARVRDLSSKPLANHNESTFSNRDIVRSMFGESIHSLTDQPDLDVENDNQTPDEKDRSRKPSVGSQTLSGSDSGSLLQSHSNDSRSVKVRNYFRNVARVGVRVSEALDHAHSYGILHRDIKPSNLLLDEKGAVWVTDFGLAKYFDSPDITRTGEVVGTLRYMSPEQLDNNASTSSDIFGLGLTLYEMLTLQPAYPGTDRKRLLEKVSQANPAIPRSIDSRIPRDLETIVMKCIHGEPSKRYTSAAEVGDDLTRFLNGQPILARRIGVIEKAWKWCQRRPALAAAFAALAASIVLGAAGVGWQWNKTAIALADSKEATEKAEKHFEQARSAVVQIMESISEEELLSTPELLPIRGKLLRKAIDYQIEFASTHQDNATLKIELANAYQNLAIVSLELGKDDESLEYIAKSKSILLPLLKEDLSPQERISARIGLAETTRAVGTIDLRSKGTGEEYYFEAVDILLDGRSEEEVSTKERFALAKLYRRLGFWAESLGRGKIVDFSESTESPMDYFNKALKLSFETPEPPQGDLGSRGKLLASLHNDLGVANRRLGNRDEALRHYNLAVEQFQTLVELEPENTDLRFSLAKALNSLGFFHGFEMSEQEKGISFYLRAIKEFRSLSRAYPSILRFTEAEALASLNCGRLCEDEEKWEEAFEYRMAAVKLSERALLFAPDSPKLRSGYGKALMGLGINCAERHDNTTALEYFARAREQQEAAIKKSPKNPLFQNLLVYAILQGAQSHRDMGNYKKSQKICLEAVNNEKAQLEHSYLAGRELLRLAVTIKSAEDDSNESALKIADDSIEDAKRLFKKLTNPKYRTQERVLSDPAFEDVTSSDTGREFLAWLKTAQSTFTGSN